MNLTATEYLVLWDVWLGDCLSADFARAFAPPGTIEVWPGVDYDGTEIEVPMLTDLGRELLTSARSEAA